MFPAISLIKCLPTGNCTQHRALRDSGDKILLLSNINWLVVSRDYRSPRLDRGVHHGRRKSRTDGMWRTFQEMDATVKPWQAVLGRLAITPHGNFSWGSTYPLRFAFAQHLPRKRGRNNSSISRGRNIDPSPAREEARWPLPRERHKFLKEIWVRGRWPILKNV